MVGLAERFGKHIRLLRGRMGMTQAELADRAGISEEWLRRIERGAASPSFDTIEALAAALGTKVVVPLGVAVDAEIEEKILAEIRELETADHEFLLEIISKLAERLRS